MKKAVVLHGILLGLCIALTGCGNPFDAMPNLTEEETALISEYAAGILIKHDKLAGRLASEDAILDADQREATRLANLAALEEAQNNGKNGEEEKTGPGEQAGSGTPGQSASGAQGFQSIAEFCGQSGFDISYSGYKVCDSYPEGNDDDTEMIFAMDATEGNKLLVVQFSVTNLTNDELELNMLGENTRFKLSINNEEMKNALSTLLLDDLSTYKGAVPAGGSLPLVLTREITEEEAGGISTISLELKNASGSATTLLQ